MHRLMMIVAAALLGWTGIAAAQDYPTRPVTMIVPFPAGGATDTLARFLAERTARPTPRLPAAPATFSTMTG